MGSGHAIYDAIGADYDLLIDWPRRLAREGPLLRQLASEAPLATALDVGGGTGRHAEYLMREAGLRVTIADPSVESLAEARRRLGEGAELLERGLGSLAGLGRYGLVLCLGNTLPHVGSRAEFASAIGELWDRLAPGGALVCHQLNYAWILGDFASRRFLPASGSDERFFVRFFEREDEGERLRFTILRVRGRAGAWSSEFLSTSHLPLSAEDYLAALPASGEARIELLGDWQGTPYRPFDSDALLVVARRDSSTNA